MGPQLCSCGNHNILMQMYVCRPASMGPQLCSCGNMASDVIHTHIPPCFNGAATLQLRKLSLTMMMRRSGPCFNGAATLQLRKPDSSRPGLGPGRGASMGPQLCSCGNRQVGRRVRCRQGGFNGAATLQLRKPHVLRAAGRRANSLQWGRNFAVAETRKGGQVH